MSQISLKNNYSLVLAVVILLSLPSFAIAAGPSGSATGSLGVFRDGSISFYSNVVPLAIELLWTLTGASFAYLAMKNVIEANPFEKTLSLIVRLAFYPAVYSLMVHKGIEWLPKFIDIASYFGQAGTEQKRSLNPDAIWHMGLDLQNAMVVGFNDAAGTGLASALKNIFPSMMLTVVCVLVLFAFGLMAVMVYWITAEAYILIAIAPILFALGGSHWTKDIAQKPWNSMIGVTVKLIILYIVLSVAISAIPSWGVMAATWSLDNWGPLWTIAWQALLFGFLSFKIPQMAQNALTGSASLSPGEALQIAATAIAAGVGAAAAGGRMAGTAVDTAYGAGKSAIDVASLNKSAWRNPLDDIRAPGSNNSTIPNMYEPLDHSRGPVNLKAEREGMDKSGKASDASISGNASSNQSDYKPSKTDSVRGALDTFGKVIPNDQATVGGDLVKNHKE
jgi:type IV secretion system protein TrbL